MLTRRAWLAGSALGALLARTAFAQDYPARPVRVIVPYPPGGATDVLGRLLAPRIEQELKQSFVIDNRGGGASQVGTQAIATAPADGYTIGLIDSAFTINPGLFAGKLPYDTLKDFAAVSLVATAPLVLVAHPSLDVKTAQELVALAKQKPGSLTFAIAGPRHAGASRRRTAASGRGHRGGDGALSRRGAVDRRFHRRSGTDDVCDRSVDPRTCARRTCPRARDGRRAFAAAPRCADHGAGGPCRHRCGADVRACRAGGDARCHRQSAERGGCGLAYAPTRCADGWKSSAMCRSARRRTNSARVSVRTSPNGRASSRRETSSRTDNIMTVTIERVETIVLRIPYDHWAPKPTFGGIARDTMDCLLLRVTASNGLVGWGEAFWGGWQATQAAVEHWIAPLARGQDVNDRQMFARFERSLHNFGRSGPLRLCARRARHRALGPARQARRRAGARAARRQEA